MRRAKYDEHKCDVLAQEQLCLSYLIGRMPVHPKKQDVSWDEHVKERMSTSYSKPTHRRNKSEA